MISEEEKAKRKYHRKRWRFFYYGGNLHRNLGINRGRDEISAWVYVLKEKRVYSWLDVKRHGEPAMTYTDVSKIIGRAPRTIRYYVYKGYIDGPQRTYSLKTGNPGMYMFSKKHVLDLYNVVREIHFGRPRKDGFVQARNIPDINEVRAAVESNLFIYAKGLDGDFVPVWKSEDW